MPLARRLNAPDGSFAGVLIVSLDPYYLARFYETVDLGPGGTVMLVGRDGIVRARVAFTRASPEAPYKPQITIGETVTLQLSPDAQNSSFHVQSALDNVSRVVSYSVLPDYPLVVGVGLSDNDLFARIRREPDASARRGRRHRADRVRLQRAAGAAVAAAAALGSGAGGARSGAARRARAAVAHAGFAADQQRPVQRDHRDRARCDPDRRRGRHDRDRQSGRRPHLRLFAARSCTAATSPSWWPSRPGRGCAISCRRRAAPASSAAAAPTAPPSTWRSRSPISTMPAAARPRSSSATSASGSASSARSSRPRSRRRRPAAPNRSSSR